MAATISGQVRASLFGGLAGWPAPPPGHTPSPRPILGQPLLPLFEVQGRDMLLEEAVDENVAAPDFAEEEQIGGLCLALSPQHARSRIERA